MKRIGLIGGMSWHSTLAYYQKINEIVHKRLGHQHSADIILKSLDFETVLEPWKAGQWNKAAKPIINSIAEIEAAGANFFLLCSNAIHKISEKLMASAKIPMLHIGDAVADKISHDGLKTVGLLGTLATMESNFYAHCLSKHGVRLITPTKQHQQSIDDLIFSEMTKGKFTNNARDKISSIIDEMVSEGSEGVILGCTELPLLFAKESPDIPVFDTLQIHVAAAVDEAFKS